MLIVMAFSVLSAFAHDLQVAERQGYNNKIRLNCVSQSKWLKQVTNQPSTFNVQPSTN